MYLLVCLSVAYRSLAICGDTSFFLMILRPPVSTGTDTTLSQHDALPIDAPRLCRRGRSGDRARAHRAELADPDRRHEGRRQGLRRTPPAQLPGQEIGRAHV